MAVQSPTPVRSSPRRRHPAPPQPKIAAPAAESPTVRTDSPAATSQAGASGWGGTAVLVVPTACLFAIVAVVVAVNEVNEWWTLVFAMVFVVIATLCVVATIGRMLGGEDD